MSLLRRRLSGNYRKAVASAVAVAIVRLVDRVIVEVNVGREDKVAPLVQTRWFLAGLLGSASALLIDSQMCKSTLLVFWSLIRAVRCYAPDVQGGSTAIMMVSAGIILSAYLTDPDELDASYVKFLNRQAGRKPENMAKLRELAFEGLQTSKKLALEGRAPVRPTGPHLPILSKIGLFLGLNPPVDANHLPCAAVHPGLTCAEDKVSILKISLKRTLRLYVPLHLLFFVVSPKRDVVHLIANIARSSLFLTTCGFISWLLLCLASHLGVPLSRGNACSVVSVAGLAALIERDSRRKEMAAYSLTYAAESLYKRALKFGLVTPSPVLHWVLISLACATMLHNHHQQHPLIMKWLFQIQEPRNRSQKDD